jgi:hypothetical protein
MINKRIIKKVVRELNKDLLKGHKVYSGMHSYSSEFGFFSKGKFFRAEVTGLATNSSLIKKAEEILSRNNLVLKDWKVESEAHEGGFGGTLSKDTETFAYHCKFLLLRSAPRKRSRWHHAKGNPQRSGFCSENCKIRTA